MKEPARKEHISSEDYQGGDSRTRGQWKRGGEALTEAAAES